MKNEQLLKIKQCKNGFSGYSSLVEYTPKTVEKPSQKNFYIHLQNQHQQKFTDNGQINIEYYGDENQIQVYEQINRKYLQDRHKYEEDRMPDFIIELLILRITQKLRRLPNKDQILKLIKNVKISESQISELLLSVSNKLKSKGYLLENEMVKLNNKVNAIRSLICNYCRRIACQKHKQVEQKQDFKFNEDQVIEYSQSQSKKQQDQSDLESYHQILISQRKQILHQEFALTYQQVFGGCYKFINGLDLLDANKYSLLKSIIIQRQLLKIQMIKKSINIKDDDMDISMYNQTVKEGLIQRLNKKPFHIKEQNISCKCPIGQDCKQDTCECRFQYCDRLICRCDQSNCQRTYQGCNCIDGCKTDECPCEREQMFCQVNLCQNCITTNNCNKVDSEVSQIKFGIANSSIQEAGLGLFALSFIRQGTLIGKYQGEIIDEDNDNQQYERRTLYKNFNASSYIFTLQTKNKEQGFVDAQIYGNFLRFINHKSNKGQKANLVAKYRRSKGDQLYVAFYAKKDIKVGQEFFFDYGNDYFLKSNDQHQALESDVESLEISRTNNSKRQKISEI